MSAPDVAAHRVAYSEHGAAHRLRFILRAHPAPRDAAARVLSQCADARDAERLSKLYEEARAPRIDDKRQRALLCHPDRWRSGGAKQFAHETMLRSEEAHRARQSCREAALEQARDRDEELFRAQAMERECPVQ